MVLEVFANNHCNANKRLWEFSSGDFWDDDCQFISRDATA